MPTKTRGIDSTTLKLMALGLMLLDHIHYMFEFTGAIPLWFTLAGRLSAPLFLFCAVEGFAHTHDRRRYFARIWGVSAGMGAVLFAYYCLGLWHRGDGFYPQNSIFMSFVILCVFWQGIDWLAAGRKAWGVAALLAPVVWAAVSTALLTVPSRPVAVGALLVSFVAAPNLIFLFDGGLGFIVGGVLLYLFRGNRRRQLVAWLAWTLFFDVGLVWAMMGPPATVGAFFSGVYRQALEVLAVIPMALYNGQKGRGLKSLFYWFYPVHVYLLYALSCVLYGGL